MRGSRSLPGIPNPRPRSPFPRRPPRRPPPSRSSPKSRDVLKTCNGGWPTEPFLRRLLKSFKNVPVLGLASFPVARGVGEVFVGLDVRPEILEVLRQRSEEHTSELQSRLHLVC